MISLCVDGLSTRGGCAIPYLVIERRLGKLLKDQGRSLYWLSKETGISEQALSNLIKGKSKGIEFETLDRICKKLKCQPGDLLRSINDEEERGKK